jgi:hypothetical protein
MKLKALLLVALLSGARCALATPVLCSPGNQDSTCVPLISGGPIPAPRCSTDAGWTTTSPAVWQGSHWSEPQCNYEAPPTCPSGYTQTSSPVWNGSSWSEPGCTPPRQPVLPADQEQACQSYLISTPEGRYFNVGHNVFTDGPLNGSGLVQYNAILQRGESNGLYTGDAWTYGSPGTPNNNDLFFSPLASDQLFCWVQPGTTNVTAVQVVHWCNGNGGSADCGGR